MTAAAPEATLRKLVDEVTAEQAQLTAVERFALSEVESSRPALATWYEELIPSAKPGAGEQYAFRVDLDACTGCKACVTACHSMNGLDEGESFRQVGLLIAGDAADGAQQTVTGACHHCADPGCMNGCPVRAYEKDETTGIVRHLDDQCIGCQYCTLTCPYDVPQYNERLGIVRKCDMCAGRLDQGEAPACVQGCPNGAITIEVVPVVDKAARADLLPSSSGTLARSTITGPSSQYVSAKPDGATRQWRPADLEAIAPAPAHWPLAILLVCTQFSVGLATAVFAARWLGFDSAPLASSLGVAFAFALMGQGAAIAHLGRPLYAFRALLGLRTSWMSREIAALGAYLALLSGTLASSVVVPAVFPGSTTTLPPLVPALGAATVVVGWVGVVTSIMIYGVTGRPSWTIPRTSLRFVGAALATGSFGACALAILAGSDPPVASLFFAAGVASSVSILAAEAVLRRLDESHRDAALVRAARIETEQLADRVRIRRVSAAVAMLGLAVGLVSMPATSSAPLPVALIVVTALGAALVSTLAERNLFFASEASRGMPGV